MKTLILWLALVVACSAQTLKWEATLPVPDAVYDHCDIVHAKADGAGNLALCLSYQNGSTFVGSQVVWYSSNGKMLLSDKIPQVVASAVLVTPVSLMVQIQTAGGQIALRKYTRGGGMVKSKDTILQANEYAGVPSSFEMFSASGFFVLQYTDNYTKLVGIKRYSFR